MSSSRGSLMSLKPIALQGAQVVGIAKLDPQLLEDRPVPIAVRGAELAFEMAPEIVLYPVVVEQRIVAVEQEHHVVHAELHIRPSC